VGDQTRQQTRANKTTYILIKMTFYKMWRITYLIFYTMLP